MDRAEWEKKYREQCYTPVTQAYMEQVMQDTTEQAAAIHKELNGQMDTFFTSLCMMQERNMTGPVQTISISFPYTSIVCGHPYLRFAVYPDIPFLDDVLIEQDFPVSWLFSDWNAFVERLYDEAANQGMSTVIRKPYVKSHAWGIARMILRMMSTTVKYHFYGLDERKSFQRLDKSDGFTLYFGEYMDWQRPLLALRGEVDIFHCEKDTDLRFRQFVKAWYEEKEFEKWKLDDCRFSDCTFQNCRFSETSFKDARFLGCVFINCRFEEVSLHGARFDGCKFEQAKMNGIRTNSFSGVDSNELGMQGMTEFIGCFLEDSEMKDSDFSASYFRNCQITAVKTSESTLPESFSDSQR